MIIRNYNYICCNKLIYMKLKNIGNKEIRIAFTPKKGKMIIADLKPGQIIFGEPGSIDNKQIVILKRKGKIEVFEDDKPKNGEYYKPYGLISHEDVVKLTHIETKKTTIILEVDEDDDVEIELPEIGKSPVKEDESEFSLDEAEDDFNFENDEQDSTGAIDEIDDQKADIKTESTNVSKNKGGRPKGSKNKPKKRGRPSNKKKHK